jgi:hypothetical protein
MVSGREYVSYEKARDLWQMSARVCDSPVDLWPVRKDRKVFNKDESKAEVDAEALWLFHDRFMTQRSECVLMYWYQIALSLCRVCESASNIRKSEQPERCGRMQRDPFDHGKYVGCQR